jgi:hypothetical protein
VTRGMKAAEDVALELHKLTPRQREKMRRDLPGLLVPILRSVNLAATTAAEPVGALGHLAFARAEISEVLDRAVALVAGK